jgi:beta-glucosidase
VLSGGGGAPLQNDAAGWRRMVEGFQASALTTRLGIPILYGVDAVHGHNNVVGATIFPHQVGLGAVRDPDLVERIWAATAEELVATGIPWDFGPVVAVPQDVRWGRTYEGFHEDPTVVSTLTAAAIRGLQGPTDAPTGVLGTAKHFAGDGGTAWGSSTTNGYLIDQGVTDVDAATFDAIHVAPYRAAIEAGARIVMASFSSTASGKVHGDRHLLTDVLKGDLGFSGFVVSDWAGVDQVDPDYAAAVAQSTMAGIDMVMVPSDGPRFADAVRAGLAAGTIDQARIDDAVMRILGVKFELGLFETPVPVGDPTAVGSAAHRALGREAAARSAVLLQTTAGALPLSPDEAVLLAGSGADDIGRQSGGWTISWQGSDGPITQGTTIADALGARLGDRLSLWDPADETTRAPVGIVVVSEPPYAEGVGDSATLTLPASDLDVVAAMRPRVDRLVVVVLSGRPVMLDEILPVADAVVAAWLPGTEGGGVVDVLYGDVPFEATTPFAWPRTADDAPRTGKESCDGGVFPLGFGLRADGAPIGPTACAG